VPRHPDNFSTYDEFLRFCAAFRVDLYTENCGRLPADNWPSAAPTSVSSWSWAARRTGTHLACSCNFQPLRLRSKLVLAILYRIAFRWATKIDLRCKVPSFITDNRADEEKKHDRPAWLELCSMSNPEKSIMDTLCVWRLESLSRYSANDPRTSAWLQRLTLLRRCINLKWHQKLNNLTKLQKKRWNRTLIMV